MFVYYSERHKSHLVHKKYITKYLGVKFNNDLHYILIVKLRNNTKNAKNSVSFFGSPLIRSFLCPLGGFFITIKSWTISRNFRGGRLGKSVSTFDFSSLRLSTKEVQYHRQLISNYNNKKQIIKHITGDTTHISSISLMILHIHQTYP